jgi:hypothetical protein
MNRISSRLNAAAVALVCSSLVIGTNVVTDAPAAALAGTAEVTTSFRPLVPCRLLDTRSPGQAKLKAGSSLLLVRGQCGVSADTTAVAVTITVAESDGAGYITAWPSGQPRPDASTNNYAAGETRANGALLLLGDDGNLSLFVSAGAHVIVDAAGEFYRATSATSGRYVPTTPRRALDTRTGNAAALPAGATVMVPLPGGVPADATALAVMVTITGSTSSGYLTVYPAGMGRPNVSTTNTDAPFQTRTATQIASVSPAGVQVFSSAGGHIIVDVVGYFTGPSAASDTVGLFIPATPTRILDTRTGLRLYPGRRVVVATAGVTGAGVAAVATNITVAETGPIGWVTAWAAQTEQPGTPAVSYDDRGETVANSNITSVSTAGISIASTTGTHAIIDITGWFTGTPLTPTIPAPVPGPPRVSPTGPIGCLQYVPAPSADGIYQIQVSTHEMAFHTFTVGPLGPIVVLGDSLTEFSGFQTVRALRAAGWGPICINGAVARTIEFGSALVPNGLDTARRIKTSDPIWDDPTITWVVALGTNDVGYSTGNLARAKQFIADQFAAIGPNPIWWMNVRTARPDWQYEEAVFNQAIAESALGVIDWFSACEDQHWFVSDQIHLNDTGWQARADLLTSTIQPL